MQQIHACPASKLQYADALLEDTGWEQSQRLEIYIPIIVIKQVTDTEPRGGSGISENCITRGVLGEKFIISHSGHCIRCYKLPIRSVIDRFASAKLGARNGMGFDPKIVDLLE